jgi:hypothetical protein
VGYFRYWWNRERAFNRYSMAAGRVPGPRLQLAMGIGANLWLALSPNFGSILLAVLFDGFLAYSLGEAFVSYRRGD